MTIDEHITLNLAALAEYLAVWISKGPYRYFHVERHRTADILVSVRVDGFHEAIHLCPDELRNKGYVMEKVAWLVGAVQGQYEMRRIRDQISDVKQKAALEAVKK